MQQKDLQETIVCFSIWNENFVHCVLLMQLSDFCIYLINIASGQSINLFPIVPPININKNHAECWSIDQSTIYFLKCYFIEQKI